MNSLSENINLSEKIIHIYYIDLIHGFNCIDDLINILSVEEKERANKFYFTKDKNNFIVARSFLRLMLSKYLHELPNEIVFSYNKFGKPFLKKTTKPNLKFNLSHSKSIVALAITSEREVGIDVEFMRDDLEIINMANNFFSEYEKKELLGLNRVNQLEGFYNCWTRKEAFIKGIGKGLSIPLDSFDVELDPQKPVRLLKVRSKLNSIKDWQIFDLSIDPEYKCAVAVNSANVKIEIFKLNKLC